jgi:hypothetical protein
MKGGVPSTGRRNPVRRVSRGFEKAVAYKQVAAAKARLANRAVRVYVSVFQWRAASHGRTRQVCNAERPPIGRPVFRPRVPHTRWLPSKASASRLTGAMSSTSASPDSSAHIVSARAGLQFWSVDPRFLWARLKGESMRKQRTTGIAGKARRRPLTKITSSTKVLTHYSDWARHRLESQPAHLEFTIHLNSQWSARRFGPSSCDRF